MEPIPLQHAIIALFVSTVGLTCLYSLISTIIFYVNLKSMKSSKIKDFISILYITIFIGFLYSVWNFLSFIGIISVAEFNRSIMSNFLIAGILILLIYMSFSVRNLSQSHVSKKMRISRLMSSAAEKGSRIRF